MEGVWWGGMGMGGLARGWGVRWGVWAVGVREVHRLADGGGVLRAARGDGKLVVPLDAVSDDREEDERADVPARAVARRAANCAARPPPPPPPSALPPSPHPLPTSGLHPRFELELHP